MHEQSRPGAVIHRHRDEVAVAWSGGDRELIAAVTEHVDRYVGTVSRVWHQRSSPWVHVDVHVVEPTAERPCFTLVTSGMSERPMRAPEGAEDLSYAELVMALPPDWPLGGEAGLWPLALLQDLAELPHRFGTWLWAGHTVPNGDPVERYAPDTDLCGAILATPLLVDEEFDELRLGDRDINFLSVVLLYDDELQLELDQGPRALFDRLQDAGVTEGLVLGRASAAGRPRRRWLRRRPRV